MEVIQEAQELHAQMTSLHLSGDEAVYILHPRQIIAFQGDSANREDRFMDIAGMYRKRKFIQSRISGPSCVMLGLPNGYCLKTLHITEGSDLLFEWKHILFYTEGIHVERRVQTLKNVLITKEIVKMKFHADDGLLGILSNGPLYSLQLHPEQPTYVNIGCLVAYPENATLKPCVYGNSIASQNMNVQWEITGTGHILLQTNINDRQLEHDLEGDGLVKRIMRETIPFGGIFIR